jgi:CRISPR-associated endonuclease/helicase Cas3
MLMKSLYAHTPPAGQGWDHGHLLTEHLAAVAKMAQEFASAFGAGDLAYWLGLWHDLGKCNPTFQEYLRLCHADPKTKRRGPDHKAAGALFTTQHLGTLALLIQGHHGGLKSPTEFKTWFEERLKDPATSDALQRAAQLLPDLKPPHQVPLPLLTRDRTAAELFLRMLFSTLVDADVLDTERHWSPDSAMNRVSDMTIGDLWERFECNQQQLTGSRTDTVGRARHAMYEACLAAADQPPGLFRLAMPTGGGKTRSAMAFALRHALRNEQRRIIIAVPFISITEQTAATYRNIFCGDNEDQFAVLEHHSGAAARSVDADEYDPAQTWARLAAENWDAPIVVTTTVQLFESLFANKTSRCRKLHRLAKSVIILDEAQALPPHLLQPILDGLQQLCANYGTTVVISTATQPAFETIPAFRSLNAIDIVSDAPRWFAALKRVDYSWVTDRAWTWQDVADRMRDEPQALAVVNTKKDALALLNALGDSRALHLSTLLCGAHRRDVIAEVKRRLKANEPIRLVSTQVIEAGVDLDFPLVLRAMGPLDSVIQAAGRCNREGRLSRGQVIIFNPAEGNLPRGAYRTATDLTAALIGSADLDPDDPTVARRYFQQLFATLELDREGIQKLRANLDYPEVARRFQMIDDQTEDVIVAYGDEAAQRMVRAAIDHLQCGLPGTRTILRRLQPYLVSIHKHTADQYRRQHLIEPIANLPGLGVWLGTYDPIRGVTGADIDRELLVF